MKVDKIIIVPSNSKDWDSKVKATKSVFYKHSSNKPKLLGLRKVLAKKLSTLGDINFKNCNNTR